MEASLTNFAPQETMALLIRFISYGQKRASEGSKSVAEN